MTFTIHNKNTAPKISDTILENFEQMMGFVPNLIGVIAESPFALQSVTAINRASDSSQFSPQELRVVTISASRANECQYCVPAQSTLAKMVDMPDETLQPLRNGETLKDTKLEALRRFTLTVIDNKGWVSETDINKFIAAGYRQAHVLEVVTLVAWMMLTNYISHIAQLPLDNAFMPQHWQPQHQPQSQIA